MYLWNRSTIYENIDYLKKMVRIKNDNINLLKIIYSLAVYKRLNEKLGGKTDEFYTNFIMNSPKIDNISDIDKLANSDRKDSNLYLTIYNVANFLNNFNEDYYESFVEMFKNGLINLEQKKCKTDSELFIDTVNKTSFIYIESTFKQDESRILINQFARAYQLEHNEKRYEPGSILFEDAFPNYLEYSMLDFYEIKKKEKSIKEMKKENDASFLITTEIKKNRLNHRKREEEKLTLKTLSNIITSYMLLNNDIDLTFDSVDEFIRKNHTGTKSRVLLEIANRNIEGIRHKVL